MTGGGASEDQAIRAAKYLIARSGEVTGEPLCNLKLQKLLYYAQGFALGIRGQRLFLTDLEAWNLGPVVRPVRDRFKCGRSPINPEPGFDAGDYLPENRELLDAILETYGKLPAIRLMGLTHAEPPWFEAYNIARNTPLEISTMKDFFSELVEMSRQGRSNNGRPIFPVDSLRHQRRRELSARMDRHRDKLRAIASRPRVGSDPWADDED
jgi:uncharacterized phage-associated protein